MRRSGRFDREITLSIPDEKARLKIFETKIRKLQIKDVDIVNLAKLTPGYVGADIEALIKEACLFDIFIINSINRQEWQVSKEYFKASQKSNFKR